MQEYRRPPFWLWPNLLSLDAPLVAIVWQDFLARCYPSLLLPAGRWMLALTVWAIYLADRMLDERDSAQATPRFRTPRLSQILLGIAVGANVLIALLCLRHPVFANGLVVGAGVVAYLGVFPVGRKEGPWKTPAAAILFTTGVFLIAWTVSSNPQAMLGWPAAAFCALCLGNLHLIKCWERSGPTEGTGILIALLGLACVSFGHSRWYGAVALGAALLALLAFRGQRFSREGRRVLADAVLLSPLLFWL